MPKIKETRVDEHIYHQEEKPSPSEETINGWMNSHADCVVKKFEFTDPIFDKEKGYWLILSTSHIERDE